jgi:hypothetical protein
VGLDDNALSWRLGALLGGDESKALTAEADRVFRKAGVVDVERYVTMLALR